MEVWGHQKGCFYKQCVLFCGRKVLKSYEILRIRPCIADPERIRVIAKLSDEIHEIFPYLNAILESCIYNQNLRTLTFKKEEKMITLHPTHITLTMIRDEKEAHQILSWIKNLINETYEKRSQIVPNYSSGDSLKPSDIQRLLPGTNCRECGMRSCLAFAFRLLERKIEIEKCRPLFTDEFKERRDLLMEILGHRPTYEVDTS